MSVATSAKFDICLRPNLTREEAESILAQGPEATIFALMEMSRMLAKAEGKNASVSSPATPSAMVPQYLKPDAKKRRKKPGQKAGHKGHWRKIPDHIDRYIDHPAECCPHCQGKVQQGTQTRKRYTEDIPEGIGSEVTEHTVHRRWGPRCKKQVEPQIPDALPGSTIGNRTVALTAWLHYGLGQTLQHIVDVFNHHLRMKVTKGGLQQQWYRLQDILFPWYEQIQEDALDSAVLHADETGWRVAGKGHWLWCFTYNRGTYYLIDPKRSRKVVLRFFRRAFNGTLVTDFWGAYNVVVCSKRQMCLFHLLRDLEHVEKYKHPSPQWPAFAKKLRRLLGDGMRLKRDQAKWTAEVYASRCDRLQQRLDQLIATDWNDKQAARLLKRFRRHRDHLLTFLYDPAVPSDNNQGERGILPAVIIRKNTYGNRSHRGANTQAVLMSIYRTLKQRGHDPLTTITKALSEFLTTGKLPPLPP